MEAKVFEVRVRSEDGIRKEINKEEKRKKERNKK